MPRFSRRMNWSSMPISTYVVPAPEPPLMAAVRLARVVSASAPMRTEPAAAEVRLLTKVKYTACNRDGVVRGRVGRQAKNRRVRQVVVLDDGPAVPRPDHAVRENGITERAFALRLELADGRNAVRTHDRDAVHGRHVERAELAVSGLERIEDGRAGEAEKRAGCAANGLRRRWCASLP